MQVEPNEIFWRHARHRVRLGSRGSRRVCAGEPTSQRNCAGNRGWTYLSSLWTV